MPKFKIKQDWHIYSNLCADYIILIGKNLTTKILPTKSVEYTSHVNRLLTALHHQRI